MSIIITVLILLAVLVESTLFPIPLALLILILWSSNIKGLAFNIFNIYMIGALSGGLIDILSLRPYGITVLIFLGTIFVIQRYSKKVETYRLFYLIPVVIITIGTYSWYFYHDFVPQIVVSLVTVLISSLFHKKNHSKYGTLVASGY